MVEFSFEIGITNKKEFEVLKEHSAVHLGSGTVAVLSTPSMILFMEIVARDLMQSVLSEPYSTVGTKLNISHKKAISVGRTVSAFAELINIDRKKLTFNVQVTYNNEIVGEGTHERFIINEQKFLDNLN